jgi:hypothetical protein
MIESINPEIYGLTTRDRIIKIGENHLAIVIDRKSRIVMKDGRRVWEKAEKIRRQSPGVRLSLQTSAPVCGKTRMFLQERGIEVIDIAE